MVTAKEMAMFRFVSASALVVAAFGLAVPALAQTMEGVPDEPRVQTVLVRYAAEALSEKRYADAARILNGVRLWGPYHRMAGVAHAGAGNLRLAEDAFRNALFWNSGDARAQAALGVVLVKQGKHEEAERVFAAVSRRQANCASVCERAETINNAADVLERWLDSPPVETIK
jgi:Tfp pilus assembly protein PilF